MRILDTCVLSELRRTRPDPRLITWLERHEDDPLFLSVLTLGEIERGIAKLADEARRKKLAAWLDEVATAWVDRVLDIDEAVARRWGRIGGALAARGVVLHPVDGLIAATALERGMTVVTRNVRDFAPTGAPTEDPWAGVEP